MINISIGSYGMTARLTYGQELASIAAEDLLEIPDTRASGDIEKLEIGEVLWEWLVDGEKIPNLSGYLVPYQ